MDRNTFYPSPSPCPAELYWPSPLKVPQDWIQAKPYRQYQNYLQTYLQSRQDQFPLQVEDSSLQVYLGLEGDHTLPVPVKVPLFGKEEAKIKEDSALCAGSAHDFLGNPNACPGLPLQFSEGDISLDLRNATLLSAQDLKAGLAGFFKNILFTGVEIQSVSTRGGRLIVTAKVENNFLNAFAIGLKGFYNPYDPNLMDIDITDKVLQACPVAYDPKSGQKVTFEQYISDMSHDRLVLLPYLYGIAKEKRLPDFLSFNELSRDLLELLQHPAPKQEDPEKKDADAPDPLQAWLGILQSLSIKSQIKPLKVVRKDLYVEFAEDPEKNKVQVDFKKNEDKAFVGYLSAPLEINRFFIPGKIDITHLSAEVEGEIKIAKEKEIEIFVHNLNMELGPIDYLTDGTQPGKIALLGGKIEGDTASEFLFPIFNEPAVKIQGNMTEGFTASFNLNLEAIRFRLPLVGEISLTGKLKGTCKLIPRQGWGMAENGQEVPKTVWSLDPTSLDIHIQEGDITTEKGLHLKNAALSLQDSDATMNLVKSSIESMLLLDLNIPTIQGGPWSNATLQAAATFRKDKDGFYDFASFAQNPKVQASFAGNKASGQRETWDMDFEGSPSHDGQNYSLKVNGKKLAPGETQADPIVDGLDAKLAVNGEFPERNIQLQASVKKIKVGAVELVHPTLDAELDILSLDAGKTRFEVPRFEFKANPDGEAKPKFGLLRGPLWIRSKSLLRNPLSIELNPTNHELKVKNLNVSFGVLRIHPPKLLKASQGKLSSVDIDGRFVGQWDMDLQSLRGKGKLSLLGDGEGDVHLRDAKGLRLAKPDPLDPDFLVETPMFSNTVWSVRRISGIDLKRKRINGNFSLVTDIDPAIARVFGLYFNSGKVAEWRMDHDHLPFSVLGFQIKQEEYRHIKLLQEQKEGTAP